MKYQYRLKFPGHTRLLDHDPRDTFLYPGFKREYGDRLTVERRVVGEWETL